MAGLWVFWVRKVGTKAIIEENPEKPYEVHTLHVDLAFLRVDAALLPAIGFEWDRIRQ